MRPDTNSPQTFNEIGKERVLLKSLMEANIILIPKLHKLLTKQENDRSISLMNIQAKILNKLLAIEQKNNLGFIKGG